MHFPGLQQSLSELHVSQRALQPEIAPPGSHHFIQLSTQFDSDSEHQPVTVGLQFLKSMVQQALPVGGVGDGGDGDGGGGPVGGVGGDGGGGLLGGPPLEPNKELRAEVSPLSVMVARTIQLLL